SNFGGWTFSFNLSRRERGHNASFFVPPLRNGEGGQGVRPPRRLVRGARLAASAGNEADLWVEPARERGEELRRALQVLQRDHLVGAVHVPVGNAHEARGNPAERVVDGVGVGAGVVWRSLDAVGNLLP